MGEGVLCRRRADQIEDRIEGVLRLQRIAIVDDAAVEPLTEEAFALLRAARRSGDAARGLKGLHEFQ